MKQLVLTFDVATRRVSPARNLRLMRGDAAELVVKILDAGTPRLLAEGEGLAWTVKAAPDGDTLISVPFEDFTEGEDADAGYTAPIDSTSAELIDAMESLEELTCLGQVLFTDADGEHSSNIQTVLVQADLQRANDPAPTQALTEVEWIRRKVVGDVAYCHSTEGDDETAVLGDRTKPFATGAAAFAALMDEDDNVCGTMVLLNGSGDITASGNSAAQIRLHLMTEDVRIASSAPKFYINKHVESGVITGDGRVQLRIELSGHTGSEGGTGGGPSSIDAQISGVVLVEACVINGTAVTGTPDAGVAGANGYPARVQITHCTALARRDGSAAAADFSLLITGGQGQAGGPESDPENDDAGNGGDAGTVDLELHDFRVLKHSATSTPVITVGAANYGGAAGGDGGTAGAPVAIQRAALSGIGGHLSIVKGTGVTGSITWTDITA